MKWSRRGVREFQCLCLALLPSHWTSTRRKTTFGVTNEFGIVNESIDSWGKTLKSCGVVGTNKCWSPMRRVPLSFGREVHVLWSHFGFGQVVAPDSYYTYTGIFMYGSVDRSLRLPLHVAGTTDSQFSSSTCRTENINDFSYIGQSQIQETIDW